MNALAENGCCVTVTEEYIRGRLRVDSPVSWYEGVYPGPQTLGDKADERAPRATPRLEELLDRLLEEYPGMVRINVLECHLLINCDDDMTWSAVEMIKRLVHEICD